MNPTPGVQSATNAETDFISSCDSFKLIFSASLKIALTSSSPDGLEKVAEDVGFIDTAKDHTFGDFTLADYGIAGFENARLSVGLAGLIGVGATALLASGLFMLIRKKAPSKNR